jgi:hypothetical protein
MFIKLYLSWDKVYEHYFGDVNSDELSVSVE